MRQRKTASVLCFLLLNLCFVISRAQSGQQDSLSGKIEGFRIFPEKGVVVTGEPFANPLIGIHRTNKANAFFQPFFQTLSNEGSPSRSLIFNFANADFHAYSPDLFEPYTFSGENITYFQTAKPHSNLRYSNNTASSQHFSVSHTQNLYRGLNFSLLYNVDYADGMFAYSQSMNQFFNLNLNYISPNRRLRAAAAYIRNRAYVLENGGLESDSVYLNQSFSKPETYPTVLQGAWSKQKSADFFLFASYALSPNADTSKAVFNPGRLIWNTKFLRGSRLFSDDVAERADSLATRRLQSSLFWTNDNNLGTTPLVLRLGIKGELLRFSDTVHSPVYQLISPQAIVALRLEDFKVEADFEKTFGSKPYQGDYNAALLAAYSTKARSLWAKAGAKSSYTYYIYSKLLSDSKQQDDKTKKTELLFAEAGYGYKDWLRLTVEYDRLEGLARFSARERQVRFLEKTDLLRLRALVNKDFKHWGLQTDCALQHSKDQNSLGIPTLLARQSVYLRLMLFKGRLETIIGADARYNTAYYADEYLPELGLFALQDSRKYGNYVFIDFFINAKLDVCNLFLCLTHANAGLFGYDNFLTPRYPAEGLSFRWGLSWNFLN